MNSDFNEIASILSSLEESDHGCLIRDCHRIGKFIPNSERPRQILVTLGSTTDVSYVLSKSQLLPSSIYIRRDLSPIQRKERALLSQERKRLIDNNTDRKLIKIRNSSIFVSGRLTGRVVDGVFVPSDSLGDLVPSLAHLVNSSNVPPPTPLLDPSDPLFTPPTANSQLHSSSLTAQLSSLPSYCQTSPSPTSSPPFVNSQQWGIFYLINFVISHLFFILMIPIK